MWQYIVYHETVSYLKMCTVILFFTDHFVSYLKHRMMLKECRVTHKSNIVDLQFKLLSTHIRFGGQDGGEDDVREPLGGSNKPGDK